MKLAWRILRLLSLSLVLLVSVRCDDSDEKSSKRSASAVKADLEAATWDVTYFFDTQDETHHFTGYVFTFNDDGTVVAAKDATAVNGLWSVTSASDGITKLVLDFGTTEPFDELNDDWDVLEHTSDLLRLRDVSGGSGETDLLTFEKIQ